MRWPEWVETGHWPSAVHIRGMSNAIDPGHPSHQTITRARCVSPSPCDWRGLGEGAFGLSAREFAFAGEGGEG